MNTRLQWGILGTGNIAKAFAQGVRESQTGELRAVGSRTQAAADAFAGQEQIPTAHGAYSALLDDPAVDAVYISTPHPMHAEWAVKAADAGKHILCEKPIALNHADTMQIVEAARRNDVFLMEAFMYRCNPQTTRLVELIRDQAIGELRIIHAEFGFHAGRNLEGRLFSNALGGGGILDVGCYPVSMSRLLAGAAQGKGFADPVEVTGCARIPADSRVDEWAVATLQFEGGVFAQVSTAVQLQLRNQLTLYGSAGRIEVPSPWMCNGREPGVLKIWVHRPDKAPEEIKIAVDRGIYAIEADTVAMHINARQAPGMSWDDTLGNMRTLDRWRSAAGLPYDGESAEACARTVDGRPLRKRSDAFMPYGELAGVGKPISRLIMGCDNQTTIAHASAMYDDFFTRGGNAFDTAYVYAGGLSERLLGQWIANRNLREDVVVITKGAHTPHCYPDDLVRQLQESLERLQTNFIDLYFMHRDNPNVPVGEFVDVLNDLHAAGRIGAFGGSNWTRARVEEANAWAAAHGKQGFAAVSNNFSLARMVNPLWDGCIASSVPELKAWHEQTGMPLFAWSSQARGFFIPERAHPDQRDDPMLAHSWYSQDNFLRQARCFELARQKNVHPVNIALAYVLHQAFPVYALIGPHTLQETVSSLQGLHLSLTPAEVRWLNLDTKSD